MEVCVDNIVLQYTIILDIINSFTLSGTPLVKVTVDDSIVYPVTDLIANANKTYNNH